MSDSLRERLQAALGTGYELERELTGGGMSRVFVARDRALGRQVVVKVLPPELAAGVNRERFEREIQLAAQLQHPHIVQLLSAGEVPEEPGRSVLCPYYTMPYIEGEALSAQLQRRGPLPVREVVRVLQDVLEALAYAHARGVIHRDIKPANILMQGAHALVTDFGVAKALSAALPQSGATGTGMAIGTPAYMAPEQLAADPQADHRVDLYALGLVGYELLSGRSPFSASSPQATMAAQLTRVPDRISLVRPDVPAELDALLDRCLSKGAERRPANATEALAQLERVPISGGTERTVRLATAPMRAPAASRRWRWFAGTLFAGGVALALAQLSSGKSPPESPAAVAGADTAPSITVSTGTPPSQRQLTREDSLLIAAAMIERERALRAAAPQRDVDSIRNAIRKEVADSIARAARPGPQATAPVFQRFVFDSMARRFELLSDSLRRLPRGSRIVVRQPDGRLDTMITSGFGPGVSVDPPPPPTPVPPAVVPPVPAGMKRVVLMPFPPRRAGQEGAQLVIPLRDSLEAAFRRTGRYDVVGPDALAAAAQNPALRTTRRGRAGIMADLGAVAMLRGSIEGRGGNAIVIRVDVEDTVPGPLFVVSDPVPGDAPFPALTPFLQRLVRAVDEIE